MSEIQRLEDAFMKADALAQQGDAQAAEDARAFAAEIRKLQAAGASAGQPAPADRAMGQLNAGISDAVGGVVDFINPLDNEVWQDTPVGMGSAREGLNTAMRAIGADVQTEEPTSLLGALFRGSGQAAGTLPVAAGGANLLSKAPGMIGQLGDIVGRSLSTKLGSLTEVLSGGFGEMAGTSVETGGGPQWMADTARVLAPSAAYLGGRGLAAGADAALRAGEKAPLGIGLASKVIREGTRSLVPVTDAGARRVAQEELERRVGSRDRMEELSNSISVDDEFGRTPAQQVNDPGLAALEASVMSQRPAIRDEILARTEQSRAALRQSIEQEGSFQDTQAFFDTHLANLKSAMDQSVEQALGEASGRVAAAGPRNTEGASSAQAVERVRGAYDTWKAKETELWSAVPRDVVAQPSTARQVAQSWAEKLGKSRADDIPPEVRQFLLDGGFGDQEPVSELHGLASKLREVSRNARSGEKTQPTLGRVADEVAEALTKDIEAIDAVAPSFAEARAHTRALHETFDRGIVGRMMRQRPAGDPTMTPEGVLGSSVGVRGPRAAVDAETIEGAAPEARDDIVDFVRSRFLSSAMNADGTMTPRKAQEWMRSNAELLNRYPELRQEFQGATANAANADQYAAATRLRQSEIDKSMTARVARSSQDQAVTTILTSPNPAKTALDIMQEARRDATGAAARGIKSAFVDRLLTQATDADGALRGRGLKNAISERRMSAAIRKVMSAEEARNLERVADILTQMDTKPIGEATSIINTPLNALALRAAQIAGAQIGGKMGASSAGGSLQSANIGSRIARTWVENLTHGKARELLVRAVQDPQLMKDLLRRTPEAQAATPPSGLVPFLVGGGAATIEEQQGPQ
jgi:hypothetical protein